jgi:hypothetical protein
LQVFRKKYKQIADAEIASMTEYYEQRLFEAEEEIDDCSTEIEAQDRIDRAADKFPEVREFVNKLNDLNYTENKEVPNVKPPYVISPDEFGEIDEYATETLYYYQDKVLADDQDNIIEDADNVIGVGSLNHFGEYEDDSVFVRNDREETDYEILLDPREYYADVVKSSPHQAEAE